MGFIGVVFQVAFYKTLLGLIGLRQLFKLGVGGMMVGSILIPCSETMLLTLDPELIHRPPGAPKNYWLLSLVLGPCLLSMGAGIMLCLPVLTTILSNAAHPELQGLTQGMAQSSASLLRAFGPFAVGTLFSITFRLHAPAISFALLALVYAATLALTCDLPPRVEEAGWQARARDGPCSRAIGFCFGGGGDTDKELNGLDKGVAPVAPLLPVASPQSTSNHRGACTAGSVPAARA